MFAGQGTSHVGIGRCFRHGGASPSHQKHAATVMVEQRLHAEAEALTEEEAQPHRILKSLLQKTGGRLRWLDAELAREHSAEAQRLFKQERQFLSWIAKLCSEVKVEEIEAHLKQSQAAALAAMVREALTRAGADPNLAEAAYIGMRMVAAEHRGDTEAADRDSTELDRLREQIAAAERKRIEAEAQRLTGLVPAAEIAPGEDTGWMQPPEPEEQAEPEPSPPVARPRPAPADGTRSRYKTDLPPGGDPALGPF
jgi:hypothetical protein